MKPWLTPALESSSIPHSNEKVFFLKQKIIVRQCFCARGLQRNETMTNANVVNRCGHQYMRPSCLPAPGSRAGPRVRLMWFVFDLIVFAFSFHMLQAHPVPVNLKMHERCASFSSIILPVTRNITFHLTQTAIKNYIMCYPGFLWTMQAFCTDRGLTSAYLVSA